MYNIKEDSQKESDSKNLGVSRFIEVSQKYDGHDLLSKDDKSEIESFLISPITHEAILTTLYGTKVLRSHIHDILFEGRITKGRFARTNIMTASTGNDNVHQGGGAVHLVKLGLPRVTHQTFGDWIPWLERISLLGIHKLIVKMVLFLLIALAMVLSSGILMGTTSYEKPHMSHLRVSIT
ncbi:hypothetical protein QJS10_CPA06g01205 [Acorus calamus]|uniref:Uncharacterized protein n=1 Tax=Acorus calamus TaxID=4465 RepID=A0AAV9ENA3_ACOCL|nr:hypothetical protein QJS10_CPA06g01205 [Acorus calamus]